jgi:8-oxo-dGTP diphosphatase
MWADDALWLPLLMRGETFRGRFIFDGDRMVDHDLTPHPSLQDLNARRR